VTGVREHNFSIVCDPALMNEGRLARVDVVGEMVAADLIVSFQSDDEGYWGW